MALILKGERGTLRWSRGNRGGVLERETAGRFERVAVEGRSQVAGMLDHWWNVVRGLETPLAGAVEGRNVMRAAGEAVGKPHPSPSHKIPSPRPPATPLPLGSPNLTGGEGKAAHFPLSPVQALRNEGNPSSRGRPAAFRANEDGFGGDEGAGEPRRRGGRRPG